MVNTVICKTLILPFEYYIPKEFLKKKTYKVLFQKFEKHNPTSLKFYNFT